MEVTAEGDATIVATDGHRLSKRSMEVAAFGDEAPPRWIMPRDLIETLVWLSKQDKKGDASITVRMGEQNAYAEIETEKGYAVSILRRKLTGNFPDYRRVWPKDLPVTVAFAGKSFADALKAVKGTVNPRTQAIDIIIDGPESCITAKNEEGRVSSARIVVACDAAPFKVGFNHQYLTEMLAAHGDIEGINMKCSIREITKGVDVRRVVDNAALWGENTLIMPMREGK